MEIDSSGLILGKRERVEGLNFSEKYMEWIKKTREYRQYFNNY